MEKKKVLLVDDEESILLLYSEEIEDEGFAVEVAHNGDQALERFQASPPDLVILDIMLPGKDGFEICREVRKTSNIPIIMLTARGDEIDEVVGLEVGADDYMAKPVRPRVLLARLRTHLRRVTSADQSSEPISVGSLVVDPDAPLIARSSLRPPMARSTASNTSTATRPT